VSARARGEDGGARETARVGNGPASGPRQIKMLFAAGGLIKRGPVVPTRPTTGPLRE